MVAPPVALLVVQVCYGVDIIPEGDWLCQPCSRGRSGIAALPCVACGVSGGPLVKMDHGDSYVHATCLAFQAVSVVRACVRVCCCVTA